MIRVGKGKFLELGKLRLAQLRTQALAAAGGEHRGALAENEGHEGEGAHLHATHDDVVRVPVCHAHIHDGGHDQGDDKLKYGLRHNAEDGQNTVPPVWPHIGKKFLHDRILLKMIIARIRFKQMQIIASAIVAYAIIVMQMIGNVNAVSAMTISVYLP